MRKALSRADVRRRTDSGDDTRSQLVNVTDRPGGSRAEPPLGVPGVALAMVAGDIDPIAGLFGGALDALSIRRDQRTMLLDDPAMVPRAIELLPLSTSG